MEAIDKSTEHIKINNELEVLQWHVDAFKGCLNDLPNISLFIDLTLDNIKISKRDELRICSVKNREIVKSCLNDAQAYLKAIELLLGHKVQARTISVILSNLIEHFELTILKFRADSE